MPTLIQKFMGAQVGVHVGDSLGAPYETWKRQKIVKDIADRKGLIFFDYENPWQGDGNKDLLPAGRPTDDSDQSADLAFSLIESNGLNTDHLREALRDSVVHGKSRLWDGKATGSGRTTRNALSDDAKTSKINGVPMNNFGTNGSLMRTTPLALWTYKHSYNRSGQGSAELFAIIENMSTVTHDHPHSIDACYIYTLIMHQLLSDQKYVVLSDPFANKTGVLTRLTSKVNDKYCFPMDPGAWPERGSAEFSLYVAVYTLFNAKDFADGMKTAITIGGDTDTYAAIAGGLLGAKFGYEGIPKAWREAILGHGQMVEYAEKLYKNRPK